MEEVEEKFIKAFNDGYLFSKNSPEVAQSITEQNKSTDELNPINGMLGGMEEGLKNERDLFKGRLNELKDIENRLEGDRNFEKDR